MSLVPAATLVIWRVTVVPLPTETAAWVAVHTPAEAVVSLADNGSVPA